MPYLAVALISLLDGIVADLMAQPPGAGMHHDRHLILKKPQGPGRCRIINRFHVAHFHKMIARSQGPQLVLPPFQGPVGNEVRPGPFEAPSLLDMLQILGRSIALPNGPLGPLLEDLFLVFRREFKVLAVGTHAGRDIAEQGVHDFLRFVPGCPGGSTRSAADALLS